MIYALYSMFYSMFYVLMFYLWKICIICIYLPETDTFIGLRMFPTVHHREFPCVQGNTLTIPLTFFHQLLYTNQYFLNKILVVSHTCTRTHTHHWRLHFHLWIFISQTRSWAISIIWNIWMSDKNSEKERQSWK